MRRRDFLAISAAIFTTPLASPYVTKARANSGTPVVNGKRVRRRLSTLSDSDPFFAAYAQAVDLMHQQPETSPRSWIAQARLHADFCQHGTVEFFPWHRPYLSFFEHICGTLIGDATFALPYWNWGDNNGRLPAPFFANGPLNVTSWTDPGSYNGQGWGQINTVPYRYARADFGLRDSPFAGQFSDIALQNVENAPNFSLLSELTENPHGTAHVVTGGNPDFALGTEEGHFSSGLSPLDPIFWLHHANVDRIWAQSAIPVDDQKSAFADLNKTYSGIFVDGDGQPASPVLGTLFGLDNQDYIYDFMVPDLLSDATRSVQEQIASAQPTLQEFVLARGIARADTSGAQVVIGTASAANPSVVGAINRIDLTAPNIGDVLTTQRVVSRPLAILEFGDWCRRRARLCALHRCPACGSRRRQCAEGVRQLSLPVRGDSHRRSSFRRRHQLLWMLARGLRDTEFYRRHHRTAPLWPRQWIPLTQRHPDPASAVKR